MNIGPKERWSERWQCPINIGALYLVNFVEDIVVYLVLKVFNFDIF